MASLTVLEGANRGAVFSLLPDVNRVGRDPLSEVVLLDEAASRAHAELSWEPAAEAFRFRDLESRNGTWVNGLPTREALLQHGDELRVGESVLLFTAGDEPPALGRSGRSTIVLPEPSASVEPEAGPARPRSVDRAPRLIGESPQLRAVLEAASRCARLEVSVLIRGETGTGKELLAEAIHRASPRRGGPLVAINAANLGGDLCESELFGHERGAFTGAVARRVGCFERAQGGTLFLDEVAEVPLETQAKLLRVLETRTFQRVGGTRTLRSDFRLVAATHRDLHAMVEAGTFREDLLYRFDVARLELPPLRERPSDVALLAQHFVEVLAPTMGSPVRGLEPDALEVLASSEFPGNVRELRNWIERSLIYASGSELSAADLVSQRSRPRAREVGAAKPLAPSVNAEELAGFLDEDAPIVPLVELERREIERALRVTGGNKTQAARLLGIDRKTLYGKLERHGRSS